VKKLAIFGKIMIILLVFAALKLFIDEFAETDWEKNNHSGNPVSATYIRTHINRGNYFLNQGRILYYYRSDYDQASEKFRNAIAAYDKALDAIPENTPRFDRQKALAYSHRGHAKSELGNYLKAISDFRKVIEIKPDYCEAYFDIASLKYEIGDHTGALEEYRKISEKFDGTQRRKSEKEITLLKNKLNNN